MSTYYILIASHSRCYNIHIPSFNQLTSQTKNLYIPSPTAMALGQTAMDFDCKEYSVALGYKVLNEVTCPETQSTLSQQHHDRYRMLQVLITPHVTQLAKPHTSSAYVVQTARPHFKVKSNIFYVSKWLDNVLARGKTSITGSIYMQKRQWLSWPALKLTPASVVQSKKPDKSIPPE